MESNVHYEAAKAHALAMGEHPKDVDRAVTRTLIFNGEAVTVAQPSRQWVSQKDEE